MKILIRESQFQRIIESELDNYKPSKEFDRIYNTSLSQVWDFGDGLTSDDVWDFFRNCSDNEKCDELNNLILRLNEKMFPFPNVQDLPYETKGTIIAGMASELNFDDIVHFTIYNRKGTDKSVRKFYNLLNRKQQSEVQWVPSPSTTKTIKKVYNL